MFWTVGPDSAHPQMLTSVVHTSLPASAIPRLSPPALPVTFKPSLSFSLLYIGDWE